METLKRHWFLILVLACMFAVAYYLYKTGATLSDWFNELVNAPATAIQAVLAVIFPSVAAQTATDTVNGYVNTVLPVASAVTGGLIPPAW